MATYKLIQDIEAEDHILGPLSLRQFIFAMIAVFFGYVDFICVAKGAPFLLAAFGPPTLFFAFFAFPFGKDQSTEVWFLAKLRFWFLPRKRIWDQSGVKELVTITVPKKVERVLTDGLSQTEVKSRLNALANTIDSRGWAIKNVNIYSPAMAVDGDRLIDLSSIPQEVPANEISAASDMLDTENNPVAHQMDTLVNRSAKEHHKKLLREVSAPAAPVAAPASNNWFMGQGAATLAAPAVPMTQPQPVAYVPPPIPAPAAPAVNDFAYAPSPAPAAPVVPAAAPTGDETELIRELKQHADSQDLAYEHMRTLRPGGEPVAAPVTAAPAPAVTTPSDPAILALASNNDLNVETLARQANKARDDDKHPDEVVISLH